MNRSRTIPVVGALAALGLALGGCSAGGSTSAGSDASDAAAKATSSAACQALQKKYPQFSGKTLKNAINPHTPGYESPDPTDPSKYVGFDIDFGEAIGSCLGFKVSYLPVAFAELIPTMSSGQADWVISDIYATKERAAKADFVTYSKVFDGILVKKGNPKGINGINLSLCGSTVALNTGFVEVPLVEAMEAKCKSAGKPAPKLSLFSNNDDCMQAILAGRADAYINDVNTVNTYVKQHSSELAKAKAVLLPYKIGIAVPQNKHDFRSAVQAAVAELQRTGVQTRLAKKNGLDASAVDAPTILSVK